MQTDTSCEVHPRHRRRRLVARQGAGGGVDRRAARGARLQGRAAEVRPLHQRRSGHDEPVPARRGLRHRRRRRDRPRSRALRALHQPDDDPQQQLDDRQDLPVGDPEGAARRLPRAAPSRSFRTSPTRSRTASARSRERRRHRPGRDRRHGRRHREPAVPRSHPPAPAGRRPREHALHPPDARAVHRRRRRAEDQADAAQRPRPARHRHPARHPALPHRSLPRSGHQAQDRALLRRRRGGRHHGEGRLEHLRGAAGPRRRRARSDRAAAAATCRRPRRGWTAWVDSSIASRTPPTR